MRRLFLLATAAAVALVLGGLDKAAAYSAPSSANVSVHGSVRDVAFVCKFSHGKLVCGDTKSGNKNKNKNKDGGSKGEHSCPVGYVVLDKPNKCGSYCEPKSGDPCATPAKANNIGYECQADVNPPSVAHYSYTMAPPLTEPEARAKFAQSMKENGYVAKGPVTCKPVEYK